MSKSVKTIAELTNLISEKQVAWLQHILLLSSTLFGVLVSLHTKIEQPLYIRLLFSLSIVLLGLGILLAAISLYSQLDDIKRTRQSFVDKSVSALHEGGEVGTVYVKTKKIFLFSEKASYICLILSILLFSAYTVLLSF